jgi:hypothetical protein
MNAGSARGRLVGPLILGGAWVLGAMIVGKALVRSRSSDDIIRVVGSARRPIRSDFIIWRGRVSRTAPQMATVYTAIQGDLLKVEAYLKSKGIPEKEIFPQAVVTTTLYQQVKTENGYSSDSSTYRPVAGYQMSQDIEVRSDKLDLLDDLSRKSSELLSRGVPFESEPPSYLYTKLSDLKVTMQAEAAKDARQRALGIAEAAGGTLGEVRWARMTAPSLTPLYSGGDNDGGTDDTTSLEKKITAIVTVGYGVK